MWQLAQTPITGELFRENSCDPELIPILIKQDIYNINTQRYRQKLLNLYPDCGFITARESKKLDLLQDE